MEPPSRAEVANSLISMCDVLLQYTQHSPDGDGGAKMTTKLRAVKNYADTCFSAADRAKLQGALQEQPAVVAALRERNVSEARGLLESFSQDAHVSYALSCVTSVHEALRADDKDVLWDEIDTLCLLAPGGE